VTNRQRRRVNHKWTRCGRWKEIDAITKRFWLPALKKSILAQRPLLEAIGDWAKKRLKTRRQRRKLMRRPKKWLRMRVGGGEQITSPIRYTRTEPFDLPRGRLPESGREV
jgi:hypothetical protein